MARIYHRLSDFDTTYGKQIPKFTIVYHGNFSAGYMYYILREWLIEKKWCPRSEEKFGETFYEQRETSRGDEIFIRWYFEKDATVDLPGDRNFIYQIDIVFHIMFLKDIEVMIEGKREKIQNGEVEIKVDARQVFQKEGWDEGWLKVLKPYIWKRYYLKKKKDVETHMIKETKELQNVIRQYFELSEGLVPEYQAFFKTGGEGK